MNKHKVLIIKTGYSEFLDKEDDSRKVSLGDILRTTPILHAFKKEHVTWVTDEYAFPLLKNNHYIDRLLRYDFTTVLQLETEVFDTVINLEKTPGICALAGKIPGVWRNYGFRIDPSTGEPRARDQAFEVLAVSSDINVKKENKKTTQELLFELIGKKWNKEEYILGYQPKIKETYDIGLNTYVGQKWPSKAWPEKKWDELENLLTKNNYTVSMQNKQEPKVLENLYSYMDWINSCKLIVSNDSLGLHLGIALKKKVLGLFGPTPYKEVYFYNKGKAILPKPILDCMPCFKGECENKDKNCMENISPERVIEEIKNIY